MRFYVLVAVIIGALAGYTGSVGSKGHDHRWQVRR